MAFIEEKTKQGGSIYLKIVTGVPSVIMIMDEHAVSIGKHWLRDGTGRMVGLVCPGYDTCPICIRNRELGSNKEHPDYIPYRTRYRVNVLDLTPGKRCPDCGAVYAAQTLVCSNGNCGANLRDVEVKPIMQVKILERGRRLMEQFAALEQIPHPLTGEVEKLQSYPIMLVATGSGREMTITAIPQAQIDVDISKFTKLDLSKGIVLTPEEIKYLLEGGSYRDIIAARYADDKPEPDKTIPF